MQKIIPFLWYDNNAEEAAEFYISVFKEGKIKTVSRYSEGGPMPAGTAMVVVFELFGQEFNAMNGGPHFKFNEAVSMYVKSDTQEEIDGYWNAILVNGGKEQQCGWIKDKYGLSWQIVPPVLGQLLQDKDKAKAGRVMQAMMKMVKIDIQGLKDAYEGQ